ncbi:MAG: hypothetical protein RSE18_00975 [Acinetobacter sp.]
MNTELIIKAVNAVIEFNQKETNAYYKMTAQIDISRYTVACRVWWNWENDEFKDSSHAYSCTDEEIQQFINKLQELSQ